MSRRPTDDEILDAVFSRGGEIVLPGTFGDQVSDAAAAEAASKISDTMLMQLKQYEQDAVGLAETGDMDGAYASLSRALTCVLHMQVHTTTGMFWGGRGPKALARLRHCVPLTSLPFLPMLQPCCWQSTSTTTANQGRCCYDDLCQAITHGTLIRNQHTLKQAYTQRAIIKKKRGDLSGADEDFIKGAQYGNEVAKGMVKNNPYAKL
ncbi:hypothetical protein BASA60_009303 [Batrachochytrium salamandrivorans]|nr:hypothetical protein BASA60_009303 [Batrachochytrium salamandrivorans]